MDEEEELHEICHNGEVDELRQFIRDASAGYDFNQYEVSVPHAFPDRSAALTERLSSPHSSMTSECT